MKKNVLKVVMSLNLVVFSNYFYKEENRVIHTSDIVMEQAFNDVQLKSNYPLHEFDIKRKASNGGNLFVASTQNRQKIINEGLSEIKNKVIPDITGIYNDYFNEQNNTMDSFEKFNSYLNSLKRDEELPLYETGLSFQLEQDNIMTEINDQKHFNIDNLGDLLNELDDNKDIVANNSRFWNVITGGINSIGCAIGVSIAQCGNVEQSDDTEEIVVTEDLKPETTVYNIYVHGLNGDDELFGEQTWYRTNALLSDSIIVDMNYDKYFGNKISLIDDIDSEQQTLNQYESMTTDLVVQIAKKMDSNNVIKDTFQFKEYLKINNIKLNLIGHSFGGFANTVLSNKIPQYINSIVNIGSPHGDSKFLSQVNELEKIINSEHAQDYLNNKEWVVNSLNSVLASLIQYKDNSNNIYENMLSGFIGFTLENITEYLMDSYWDIINGQLITKEKIQYMIDVIYESFNRNYARMFRGDDIHFDNQFLELIENKKKHNIKTASIASGVLAGGEFNPTINIPIINYGIKVNFSFKLTFSALMKFDTDALLSVEDQNGSRFENLYDYKDKMYFLAGFFHSDDPIKLERYNRRNIVDGIDLGSSINDVNKYKYVTSANNMHYDLYRYIPHALQSNHIDFYNRKNQYLENWK